MKNAIGLKSFKGEVRVDVGWASRHTRQEFRHCQESQGKSLSYISQPTSCSKNDVYCFSTTVDGQANPEMSLAISSLNGFVSSDP